MIRNLKLLFILLFSLGILGFAMSPTTSAFTLFGDACEGHEGAAVCEDAKRTDNPLYGRKSIPEIVANILSLIIGVAAVIVIIIAGIQYMLSTGDPTKVNNAKNAILYAVVGLLIAVAARTIVVFVIRKL